MFTKAKIWAILKPKNMFHGLVPAVIFDNTMIDFRLKSVMTSSDNDGQIVLRKRCELIVG